MAQAPAISVIMPVYNGEKYLQEAIDSVLGQTFGDFELLIVDDGSTDQTGAILETLQNEPKIRRFSQSHQGVSAARNRGILEAQGALIAFLDADDVYYPNALATLHSAITAHPEVDVVHAYFTAIDEHGAPGKPQGIVLKTTPDGQYQLPTHTPYDWETLLSVQFCCHLGTGLFRKSLFNTLGPFDTSFAYWEDYEFYIRIFKQGTHPVLAIPSYTYQYRFNTSSITKRIDSTTEIDTAMGCLLKVLESVQTTPPQGYQSKKQWGQYIAKAYKRHCNLQYTLGHPQNIRYICQKAFRDPRIGKLTWLRHLLPSLIKSF